MGDVKTKRNDIIILMKFLQNQKFENIVDDIIKLVNKEGRRRRKKKG